MTELCVGRRHVEVRAYWRSHVSAQLDSGQTGRAYCDAHGLRLKSFYRWRSKFASEEDTGGATEQAQGLQPSGFAEVRVVAAPVVADGGVEVVVRGERRIRLSQGFDDETLGRAVRVLEGLEC